MLISIQSRLVTALLAATVVFACSDAHAVTFNVSGVNAFGDTLSGSLEADAALTTITAINLQVSGPGPVPDGVLDTVDSFGFKLLQASGPSATSVDIFITNAFHCPGCALPKGDRSAFSATAIVSEVSLPAALPLFATVLAGGGLIAWRRKRKSHSQRLAGAVSRGFKQCCVS